MGDVIGIIGLAIAVLDQLLKAGERAAQLISEVRAFDQDAERLQGVIIGENNSNWLLRRILFDQSPIYGGRALFEQFPNDVQEETKLNFLETENVVAECIKILEGRYMPAIDFKDKHSDSTSTGSSTPNSTSTSTTLNSGTPFLVAKKSPKYLERTSSWVRRGVLLSQWSLRDKKRIEEVIKRFVALNQRVHQKIKLCSFAGSIGLDVQHLQRLQQDPVAKDLGYQFDASLRLIREEVQGGGEDSEITEEMETWSNASNVEERFATAQWYGRKILLERRPYEVDRTEKMQSALSGRILKEVNSLASLLRQPKEQVFRIPRCLGWKYSPQQQAILFAFEIEGGSDQTPISLLRLLNMDLKLSLNDKFKLALALATCIAQLQMVKWVHESFRSENILFWMPSHTGSELEDMEAVVNFSQPWVLGFECSRPETGFSGGFADKCVTRDLYRHPERQGVPSTRFGKIHDIYALGIVLLEIALWEPAISLAKPILQKEGGTARSQEWFLKQARRRVKSRVGEKYRDIVVKCLSGQFEVADDTKDDLKLQQGFRTQVLDVLEKALDSI